MNDCIHVVPGTAWIVEALAALGIVLLAMLLAFGLAELLLRSRVLEWWRRR